MRKLLKTFSWQELLHQRWRNAAAVLAVMLGVALAFSVQLINASALSEFSQAVRSAGGQPDLELRAVRGGFDETLYRQVANHPQVVLASPLLELGTYALAPQGERLALRIVGVDALLVAGMAPALMPVAASESDRLSLFAPDAVFLNPAARQILGDGNFQMQTGERQAQVRVAGSVTASGSALAVMDIGAAQELFGRIGELSRIDLRLRPGTDSAAFIAALQLPPGVQATEPGAAAQRINNLSRAYRVNLTVLALVALFTGAFLVFSVLSLSVAKRAQQFALLGVLGLTGRERLQLVLCESAFLGALGSIAGIALGSALAALALRLLGGDLGGGYFSGVAPSLLWDGSAALTYGLLGIAAALVGGWWPARSAQQLPPAQTLKGLGQAASGGPPHRLSLLLIFASIVLAFVPPIGGIALAAYLSVGLLLIGGISALPWLIALLYERLGPRLKNRLLPLLAVERARRVPGSAAVAVSGVVASLSLAVALTVMVASFRDSVTHWLDVVLPADLYVRASASSAASDTVYFTPEFVQAVAQLPGVTRVSTLRHTPLLLDSKQPAVALLARELQQPAENLPLVGRLWPVPAGQVAIYVSEPMLDLYGAKAGSVFVPLARSFAVPGADSPVFFVAGVWRDYARQFGSIAIARRDFKKITGDRRVNDLALWLAPGIDDTALQQKVRDLAQTQTGTGALIDFASSRQLRARSLKIFDRSFAVTYWLQAVAIAIGLFGVAASFSAQVLARRKEFGLLAHLGLTRRQILTLVASEGAAWTVAGALAGLALGLAVSLVLVHVVNPQSFHWTMDLALPWGRLLLLCAAVVLAGTITAWLAGRAAAGKDVVLAVKEDW